MAKKGMNRIEREKQTVQRMIELYCRHHLKVETMPEEYQHLAEFACRRLDHCKYGENKTACKNCPTHCYASKEREQIREIMRWAGPRMILYSPKDAIVHTFYNVKHWLQSLSFRTGVIVLLCCIPFYILSFAQMLLPISVTAKGILWTVLFGLAKTCQYGGLTILGVEGYKRLKNKFKRKN
ncbi:nitrous oxide-stimulated promoter family protein [Prevotella sp. E2-28]|uniref:nitrous oxide-stimulated promoter family protein n=1 Tax=Prevotella sp. E2-28 TaxID=2913620 RepID=UPI0034CEFC6F